jgi:hypothetical protein
VDSGIRPSDIEKAARKIPPGAFRIVRALQRAELLREATAQARVNAAPEASLAFGPRWFSNALRLDATRALVSGIADDFGEALLRGHAAPSVARELVQRLADRGSTFIDGVLELDGGDTAGHIAAVEMTFRAAGVALLTGAELGSDSLEALWDEVLEARLEFPDQLPCPRIEYPDPERDPLLTRGIWYLAAFSISSELGQRAGRRHPLLRPWKAREAPPELRALCAVIARDLPTQEADRRWVLRAFSLISRLRSEVGALGALDSPEVLERPAVILDEVMHGVLSWSTVVGIADHVLGLPALLALADERSVPFSSVASAIWQAWDDAQRPALGADFLATDSTHSRWFWPHIPTELLQALLRDPRATGIPYESFGEVQWRAFIAALDTARERAGDVRAFSLAPDFVLTESLERGIQSPALFECLWQRDPDRAGSELVRCLASNHDHGRDLRRLSSLLDASPPAQFPRLSELFSQQSLVNLDQRKLAVIRRFLHDRIRLRKAGYVEAYQRLSAIERLLQH